MNDGVEVVQWPTNCDERLNGNRCQQLLDTKPCALIKNKGVKPSSLYITCQKIPGNVWYKDWIAPFRPKIAINMKTCDSDGRYAEVEPSGDVSAVLTQLFANMMNETHITH